MFHRNRLTTLRKAEEHTPVCIIPRVIFAVFETAKPQFYGLIAWQILCLVADQRFRKFLFCTARFHFVKGVPGAYTVCTSFERSLIPEDGTVI